MCGRFGLTLPPDASGARAVVPSRCGFTADLEAARALALEAATGANRP